MRSVLDDHDIGSATGQFAESGYLTLPGLIPENLCARLTPEVDRWVDEGLRERSIACCVAAAAHAIPPVMEFELPAHGELLTYRPLLSIVAGLLGADFVFHHLHSDRHGPAVPGKPWHHDYEPNDRHDRSLAMVHTLHYLNGLDPAMPSLVVLPGSHRRIASGKADLSALGTSPLDGEVVIDELPMGSTVILHSALFHARRSPAAESGRRRYFVDASYCQLGARWRPVKPYWRHMLARARELGLDRGLTPELFADRHFRDNFA
jgi:hypothetical protein